MALTISISDLQGYLVDVLDRAGHHAPNVDKIALSLMGAVIWRATNEVKVRMYKGETANMIYFDLEDKSYSLSYNHIDKKIDLKDRKKREVIKRFDNNTSQQDILDFFKNL